MGVRFSTGVAVTLFTAATWLGCSGDPSPLGGPYGGTANMPNPTAENTNVGQGDDSGGGNSNGGNGGGNGGNSTSSSGGGNGSGSSTSSSGAVSSSGSNGSSTSSSGANSSTSSSGGCIFGICGSSTSSSGATSSSSSSSGTSSTSSSGSSGTPPTWTMLYNSYLKGGSIGNCSGSCHGGIGSPSTCFTWLKGQGYVGSASPAIASKSGSCLSWFGGNMPPFGPQNAQAVTDFNAWAAAGGQNN